MVFLYGTGQWLRVIHYLPEEFILKTKASEILREYALLTFAMVITAIGIYFFRFPNNFAFGGISGLSVVLKVVLPYSPTLITTFLNVVLFIIGAFVLGKSFAIKTGFVTVVLSVLLNTFEVVFPITEPLTSEPLLELILAVLLPGIGSAITFHVNASGGGTDIIALIVKKYTSFNIGTTLVLAECIVAIFTFFVFDMQTGLFTVCGLFAKAFVVDGVVESLNLCKVFTIICDNPEPICHFINTELGRGATIQQARGAYSHDEKYVITSIMRRSQASELQKFIRQTDPAAFLAITNSSEIVGKGFRSHL